MQVSYCGSQMTELGDKQGFRLTGLSLLRVWSGIQLVLFKHFLLRQWAMPRFGSLCLRYTHRVAILFFELTGNTDEQACAKSDISLRM